MGARYHSYVVAPDPQRSASLAAIHAEGAARWSGIELGLDDLAAHAERVCLDDRALDHASDVFLVCASLRGNARAIRELERIIASQLPSFLARIDRSPSFADEVRQRLLERLLGGDQPRLARYAGAGSLIGWLRVVAIRIGFDLKRASSDPGPVASESIAERLADASMNPELDLMRTQYCGAFQEALLAATRELTHRQRAVLRLYLLGRLSIDEIGKVYGVHRSTVARWISTAQVSVFNVAKEHLRSRYQLTSAEFDSLARLLRSNIQVSLDRMLQS